MLKRLPRAVLATVLAAVLAHTATAQGAPPFVARTLTVPGASSFTFQSPTMGVTYDVSVWVPPTWDATSGKKLPLLVVTDGYLAFNAGLDAARSLVSARAIPEMMIASIGSPPEDGELAFTRRRIYEFSPPDWDHTDVFGREVLSACQQIKSAPGRCTGGAKDFLKVINTELIPGLVRQFPVDTSQLGLFGVSAGGFFASFVIFQPESRFTKYIISSPAMAYGGDLIHRIEADYARTHKDLNAGIWLSSGSLEMSDPMLEAIGHIVSGHVRLGAALTSRKYPGLKLASHMLEGLGHSDAAGTALARGLRFLYGTGGTDNFEIKK
jgi:predicted alpha/beta superfamily hydrolase